MGRKLKTAEFADFLKNSKKLCAVVTFNESLVFNVLLLGYPDEGAAHDAVKSAYPAAASIQIINLSSRVLIAG
jgi:hypothetical protein